MEIVKIEKAVYGWGNLRTKQSINFIDKNENFVGIDDYGLSGITMYLCDDKTLEDVRKYHFNEMNEEEEYKFKRNYTLQYQELNEKYIFDCQERLTGFEFLDCKIHVIEEKRMCYFVVKKKDEIKNLVFISEEDTDEGCYMYREMYSCYSDILVEYKNEKITYKEII